MKKILFSLIILSMLLIPMANELGYAATDISINVIFDQEEVIAGDTVSAHYEITGGNGNYTKVHIYWGFLVDGGDVFKTIKEETANEKASGVTSCKTEDGKTGDIKLLIDVEDSDGVAGMVNLRKVKVVDQTETTNPVYEDGWHIIGKKLYYYQSNQKQTGLLALYDLTYFFGEDGALQGNGKVQEIKPTRYGKSTYYYIDANNELVSGWQLVSDNTYYFDSDNYAAYVSRESYEEPNPAIDGKKYVFAYNGILQKNKWNGLQYGDKDGCILTGYQNIDGAYYYFNEEGYTESGFKTINGKLHYFYIDYAYSNLHGWQEAREWIQIGNNWYYFSLETGEMITGEYTVAGRDYHFNSDGSLQIEGITFLPFSRFLTCIDQDGKPLENWVEIDNKKYFLDTSFGYAVNGNFDLNPILTGLRRISSNNYYFNEDGVLQTDQFINVDGNTMYFDRDGKQARGWTDIDGKTYYFQPAMAIGLLEIYGSEWKSYLFSDEGVLQRNKIVSIEGSSYYCDQEGALYVGWIELDGYTYYFEPEMKTGLYSIYDSTLKKRIPCYFTDDGHLVKDQLYVIQGYKYYFDEEGKRYEGWKTIDGNTYFFGYEEYYDNGPITGCAHTGILLYEEDGNTFYFDQEGHMQSDTIIKVDENLYYFDPEGKRYSGWKEIDGALYYFEPDAKMNQMIWLTKDGVNALYIFDEYGHGKVEEHDPVNDPAVEPTCTESGLTAGTHCSICGTILTPQEKIAALGHEYTLIPAVKETCIEDGHETGVWCPRCETVFIEPAVIPASGHAWGEIEYRFDLTTLTVSAERICKNDKTHKETVASSSIIIKESQMPTMENEGFIIYQAESTDEIFDGIEDIHKPIPALKDMDTIVVPEGTKTIETEAFRGVPCEAVVINDDCESIGKQAFADCTQLRYIFIPAGVAKETDSFPDNEECIVLEKR